MQGAHIQTKIQHTLSHLLFNISAPLLSLAWRGLISCFWHWCDTQPSGGIRLTECLLVQGGLRMERMRGRERRVAGKVKDGGKEAEKGLDRWNNSVFYLKCWVVKSAHAISSTSSYWTNCYGTCLLEARAAMDDDFPTFQRLSVSHLLQLILFHSVSYVQVVIQ